MQIYAYSLINVMFLPHLPENVHEFSVMQDAFLLLKLST